MFFKYSLLSQQRIIPFVIVMTLSRLLNTFSHEFLCVFPMSLHIIFFSIFSSSRFSFELELEIEIELEKKFFLFEFHLDYEWPMTQRVLWRKINDEIDRKQIISQIKPFFRGVSFSFWILLATSLTRTVAVRFDQTVSFEFEPNQTNERTYLIWFSPIRFDSMSQTKRTTEQTITELLNDVIDRFLFNNRWSDGFF